MLKIRIKNHTMRRFFSPVLLLKQCTRGVAQTQSKNPKVIPEFNPQNQNHLAKAIAEASMRESKYVKLKFDRETFSKEFPAATPILNICKSYELNENCIMSAIERNPEVLGFDHSNISSIIHQFQQHGFNNDSISTIISQYPHVLQYEVNDLANTIDTYRKKHFGERFIRKLLISYPLLLSLSDREIENRLSRINYLMQNRISRTTNLLLRNPSLMCCNWKEVEQRYNYLYKTMRVVEKDISRSQALTLPISHIMLRHTFLDRAGVYVRPSIKEEAKGLDVHQNPSLSDIVDTNDEEFARRVAKVSPAEFEVFKTLMHYEDELESYEDDEHDESELNLSSNFDSESQ